MVGWNARTTTSKDLAMSFGRVMQQHEEWLKTLIVTTVTTTVIIFPTSNVHADPV
jgi:hypothetical protein